MNDEEYVQSALLLVEFNEYKSREEDGQWYPYWYAEIPGHQFRSVYAVNRIKSKCREDVEKTLRHWVMVQRFLGIPLPILTEVRRETRRGD